MQSGLCANFLRASVAYVPTYQNRANFSFLRANVPINVP